MEKNQNSNVFKAAAAYIGAATGATALAIAIYTHNTTNYDVRNSQTRVVKLEKSVEATNMTSNTTSKQLEQLESMVFKENIENYLGNVADQLITTERGNERKFNNSAEVAQWFLKQVGCKTPIPSGYGTINMTINVKPSLKKCDYFLGQIVISDEDYESNNKFGLMRVDLPLKQARAYARVAHGKK